MRILQRTFVRVLALLLAVFAARSLSAAAPTVIGKTVENFQLSTHRGQPWELADTADQKLVALVFLGTECPLAKLYGPRLADLHKTYADQGVAFVGVNANAQDSITELTAYAQKHAIPFPLLKDPGNRVADQIGAERTPEVFLLDQDRKIRYHGRIDDQYGVGYSRDHAQRRDLAEAIQELLAGKQVSVPETAPIGCFIGRTRLTEPHGDITYTNQISRLFNQHCVECHRAGEIAPFPLTAYEDILGWEETILEVIDENRMPPWFANPQHGAFRNDTRLSAAEKTLLHQWVKNGMPEGDPDQLPAPPQFAAGWRMPEPDQVVAMRAEPYAVPAEGVVDYQYFLADPSWDEDKYIVAAEARPDNRAVVHHIIVYVVPPGSQDAKPRGRSILVGYAPGSQPMLLTDGVAVHVPAGCRLVFEVHYTPNGSPQADRSSVGFRFTTKDQVKKQLHGRLAVNTRFRIPPGAASHQVTAEYQSRQDEVLLEMTPHMHLRGKAFRYEAIYPSGQREILLDVPHYDFNWQLGYQLAEPKRLPQGTRIQCTAWFDNSEDNLVNPDPTAEVRWGDQSWEEMMIGFLSVVDPDPAPDAAADEPHPLQINPGADPVGVWRWKRDGAPHQLTLQLDDDKLSGVIEIVGRGKWSIQQAALADNQLTFQVVPPEFAGQVLLEFDAVVGAKTLQGNLKYSVRTTGQSRTLPWTAERAAD
ncbi:thioredoxin family protein [Lignipirellula cremea]|uniref:Thiol-disulfide oxidoreductase ResA n=1 Tax=Lignipirellula cremea TaxID=2528010 RepID=A0A518E4P2_9BACT|nr:thioredoxin family protein [Lignipirellula cremea]QDU99049.1 Thiol-disulfide oxidoreductase ResA [Lignipirellula cremea]